MHGPSGHFLGEVQSGVVHLVIEDLQTNPKRILVVQGSRTFEISTGRVGGRGPGSERLFFKGQRLCTWLRLQDFRPKCG